MKVNRFIINVLKWNLERGKRKKILFENSLINNRKVSLNIPYMNDNNPKHCFDIIYATKERKNCLVIDIHGGAYVTGRKSANYEFGLEFVDAGFDFIAVDYVVNNGKLSTKDLFNDVIKCVEYIFNNLKELDLDNDKIVITGDSAGGHFALLLSELICNKELANRFNADFKDIKIEACLVNSPVYDFENVGSVLSRSGQNRMFGKAYQDLEERKLLSPRNHIGLLNVPLFNSSCTNDFIFNEPMTLHEEVKDRDNYEFCFIDSTDKEVDHVHNVVRPSQKESKKVNKAMIDFINKYI